MFDPTAFDNMKVVIEGAIYDRDISGDLVIIDRNDIMNMAKMSREFDITFRLPDSAYTAKFEMKAMLSNLAAELVPIIDTEALAGCYVGVQFFLEHEKEIDYQRLTKILLDVWGASRTINIALHYDPLALNKRMKTVLSVSFERLITEDHLNDLIGMTEYLINTLEQINNLNL